MNLLEALGPFPDELGNECVRGTQRTISYPFDQLSLHGIDYSSRRPISRLVFQFKL
ncbi:hypothetical protein Plhal304r1_c011g0043041 [Plasmopara halstedii]